MRSVPKTAIRSKFWVTLGQQKTEMKSKAVIVMPAYNAAPTLEKTVRDVAEGFADEIILVDDSSQDETEAIAQELGLTVFTHNENGAPRAKPVVPP
jgi:glycosyltransferase involved in cell wall biosynthesis